MFKLLIVDDEKMTRQGLIANIDWRLLQINDIIEAEDGEMALEIALQTQPDILLCDVRMPRMNGIQLATQVREELPDTQIIFLSGYAQKDYLKSAIQLKAVDYVEKPIEIVEITRVLQKAVATCLADRERKSREAKMETTVALSLPLIRQKLATDLCNHSYQPEYLRSRFEKSQITLPPKVQNVTIIVKFSTNRKSSLERDLLQNQIINTVESVFGNCSIPYLLGFLAPDQLVIHFFYDATLQKGDIEIDCIRLMDQMNRIGDQHFTLSIGVGQRVNGVENIPESYRTASIAVQREFYLGHGRIFVYSDLLKRHYRYNEDLNRELFKHLLNGKTEAAVGLFKTVVQEIRDSESTDLKYIKNIFFTILVEMSELAKTKEIYIRDQDQDQQYLWEKVSQFDTLQNITEYVTERMITFSRQLDEKNKVSRTVYQAICFIQFHYPEDISIKTIAEHVFVTPNYLCQLFKKETRKTVNDYLIEVRIEHSKDFLRDRELKLYEIATKVGFGDPNYYAKVFKKITGLNPSEYRERS